MNKRPKITAEQRAAILEWYQRYVEVGTYKTIASKIGLHWKTVQGVVERFREKQEAAE